jgi:hypothetical protein
MHTPPVICEHVEHAQNDHKECGRPFSFETNSDHNAGREANDRNEYTGDAPCALNDESDEEEDEKHTSCEKEAIFAK